MSTILALWALYLAFASFIAESAKWLKSSIPRAILWGFTLLPPFFMLPAFTSEKTPVPVDHALALPPWSFVSPGATRYNPYLNDVTMQFVPWAKAVRLALKERSLPFRNRWNGCGMVLAANSQSAAFYPLSLMSLALPLAASFALLAAMKIFLTLCGMWLWLRELGVSREAAVFGAIAFSLSLTMTPWLLFPHTNVICLWPWALFALERLRREDWRAGFWTLTVVFTLWGLAGHPESAASGAALISLWLLVRWALNDLPKGLRLFKRITLSAAAAVGVSAFLLLPQILAISASNRLGYWGVFWAPHLSWKPHGPAWMFGLLTPIFPRILGDAISSPMLPVRIASYPEMGLGYFGIAGWGAALLFLRRGAKRPTAEKALLAPLLVSWAFAIGLWPFVEVLSFLPALRLIFPIRFFSWISLAGAAIAAFELDRLSEDLRTRRAASRLAPALSAVFLALLAVAAFTRLRETHASAGGLPGQQAWLALSLVTLAVFALVGLTGTRREAPLALSLALVCGGELYLQGDRLYRFGSPNDLFPPTPALDWLAARPRPFRVLGEAAALFPNSNVHAALEEIRTHDPVERRDYVEFLDHTAGFPPGEYFKNLGDRDAAVLDFLNVRYFVGLPGQASPGKRWQPVYVGADAVIFENGAVLPRVFAPRSVRLVSQENRKSSTAPANAMKSFRGVLAEMKALADWKSVAFLLAPQGGHPWQEGSQPAAVEVSDYREWTNRAVFAARNGSGREVVLVASLVQDGGWSAATSDGLPLAITHANGPFLAIAVPPGEHHVLLRYVSPGFVAGSVVTGLTLLALAAAGWRFRRRLRLPAAAS